MIHLEFFVVIYDASRPSLFLSSVGYQVIPAIYVEKKLTFPIEHLITLIKNQLTTCVDSRVSILFHHSIYIFLH